MNHVFVSSQPQNKEVLLSQLGAKSSRDEFLEFTSPLHQSFRGCVLKFRLDWVLKCGDNHPWLAG